MIRVAIIGATGYTAGESLRILLGHPEAQITYLTALPEECGKVHDVFPAVRGRLQLDIEPIDLAKLSGTADVALCCLPHKVSMDFVPQLLAAGVKVVDFSADYRLHDVALYEQVYKVEHSDPANVPKAAFGLPELFRSKIASAQLVANPGCYPTAAALALAPLLSKKLIAHDDILVNAVTGVSGAGRTPSLPYHFPEMNENLFAYGVGTHRHMPEIEQILSDVADTPIKLLFQPHVVSMDRGIAETIYCKPLAKVVQQDLIQLYRDFYADEPFVRVLEAPPSTKSVAFSNYCDVYPTVAKDRIIAFSAIDNLVKGAAGQAIQNMNIICNLPETMGLL